MGREGRVGVGQRWGVRNGELELNGYRVSGREDEKVLEMVMTVA